MARFQMKLDTLDMGPKSLSLRQSGKVLIKLTSNFSKPATWFYHDSSRRKEDFPSYRHSLVPWQCTDAQQGPWLFHNVAEIRDIMHERMVRGCCLRPTLGTP